MMNLFRYERTQRRMALTLFMNMAVVLGMYFAAHRFVEPDESGRQLLYWVNIIVPIVELGLFAFAAFFWVKNGTFVMSVTDRHFEVVDPLSESASYKVSVDDITKITQIHHKHTNHNRIVMDTKSGDSHWITVNNAYDRKALYAALSKANRTIDLPESHLRFKQVG